MNHPKTEPRTDRHWMSKVLDLAAAGRLFFLEFKEILRGHMDGAVRRVEYFFFIYLWISAGAFILALGLFDLLIDSAGIPRGVVFSVGGALILLAAALVLHAAKTKGKR